MYSELLYDMATSSSVLAELSSQITKKNKTKKPSKYRKTTLYFNFYCLKYLFGKCFC